MQPACATTCARDLNAGGQWRPRDGVQSPPGGDADTESHHTKAATAYSMS